MTDGKNTTSVRLGEVGPEVFPLGLGCMGMSGMYGAADEAESLATIQEAIDRGVTLLDTGDFYGMGHNELLVGRAIAGRRDRVQVSVKFGAQRGPDGSWLGIDTRPAAVKTFAAYSLKRLGVDAIDVYRPARLDPKVPIEETVGAIADLVKAGYVRHIGLSEVGVETIRASAERSPHRRSADRVLHRDARRRREDLPGARGARDGRDALRRVLARSSDRQQARKGDFRAWLPRFSGDHRDTNDAAVRALHAFARERDMTPAQLAVAWVRAKQPRLVPVVGARTRAQLADALGALDRPLSASDLGDLEAVVPKDAIAGTRYGAEQMAHLDSER